VPEFTLIVVPTNNVPPIPTPPETIKAPVDVEEEEVPAVTANPEVDNIFEDGLYDNVVFEDKATPEPEEEGLSTI
jgi:hypothetical protein